MRKPSETVSAEPGASGCTDTQWAKRFPTIVEYMTAMVYDDGTARETSSLSIRMDSGECKVALNDSDNERSMYTAAQTVEKALSFMEEHLKASGGSWRPWKGKGRSK